MPPKIIKIGRKTDIAEVIKQIKRLKDKEVVFDIEKGSGLFSSSENLKLIQRTGKFLGKKITITTFDDIGRILARKVGMLEGEVLEAGKTPKPMPRVARSDVKPRFSDIMGPRKISLPKVLTSAGPLASKVFSKVPSLPKISTGGFKSARFSNNFSKIFIASLIILVVGAFALAVLLPKVTITVIARSEPINRDFEITVDKTVPKLNAELLQIPGIAVSREVSQTKAFPATGTSVTGTKASGSVVIHNETTNTFKLNAATTTLVANGQKYSFTKDVSGIKPGSGNPAVGIVANEAGEKYNLPAGTRFQVVNAALGNQNVYAVNSDALAGGAVAATGSAKVLSQEDFDQAAAEMMKDLVTQIETDLSSENSASIKLVDSGTTKEILAKTSDKEIGEATDNFNMTLIARITALAFREDDVKQVITSKIKEVLSSDKYLVDTAEEQTTMQYKVVDIPNAHGILVVHFETTAAYNVSTAGLPKILAGKNEPEIKEILLSKPEVDDVKVDFWPRWLVHKAPILNGKIFIKTTLAGNK